MSTVTGEGCQVAIPTTSLVAIGHSMAFGYMHIIMKASWLHSWGPLPSFIMGVTVAFSNCAAKFFELRSSQRLTSNALLRWISCGFVLCRMKTQQ